MNKKIIPPNLGLGLGFKLRSKMGSEPSRGLRIQILSVLKLELDSDLELKMGSEVDVKLNSVLWSGLWGVIGLE